jgi:hypothetical protein
MLRAQAAARWYARFGAVALTARPLSLILLFDTLRAALLD